MKVCLFLPWYSPAIIGGTEIHVIQLAHKISANGDEVIILCPSITGVCDEFTVAGINVIASPDIVDVPASFKIAIGIKPPKHLDKFCFLLKQLNPAILHFHTFSPKHIFYLKTAKQLGIKTIITPHLAAFTCLRSNLLIKDKVPCDGAILVHRCSDCLLHKKMNGHYTYHLLSIVSDVLYQVGINSGYSNKIQRLFSTPFVVKNFIKIVDQIKELSDAIIVLSPWYKKVLLLNSFNEEKIQLIKPFINLRPGVVQKNNTNENYLKLAFVGRLIPEKGLDILLASLLDVHKEKIELHLFGKNTNMYSNQITDLKYKGYKIFEYGETAHSVVINFLKQMDVLCLPSPWMEMAPLVVQEAFSVGIPVIGSNLGGIADAIDEGYNGFLFENRNSKDLAAKINYLVNNPQLLTQMKQNCMDPGEEEKYLEPKEIQLYNSLIASRS